MKTETTLKICLGLYGVAFLLAWLIAIPMLVHTSPQSECLLFVTRANTYGGPAACNAVGVLPILIALLTIGLMVVLGMKIKAMNNASSAFFTFGRTLIYHVCVTLLVLIVTIIVTAGYAYTCSNLWRGASSLVGGRLLGGAGYGGGTFGAGNLGPGALGGAPGGAGAGAGLGSSHAGTGYTGTGYGAEGAGYGAGGTYGTGVGAYGAGAGGTYNTNSYYGGGGYGLGLQCRDMLMNPQIYGQLRMNHVNNPLYGQYYGGNYYQNDMLNMRWYAHRDNTILEMCIACSWISLILWLVLLGLLVKERQSLTSGHFDGSLYGSSETRSYRSGSGMSGTKVDQQVYHQNDNFQEVVNESGTCQNCHSTMNKTKTKKVMSYPFGFKGFSR